ncbi:unnamed protein product, partial [Strongylus vulgaris]
LFRKTLYQGAFEYAVPLYHPTHGKFELREPHRWRDTLNPWKESFRQLRHGVHVRPRYAQIYEGHIGRSIPHFETLTQALQFLDAEPDREKLILLHTGHYFPEPILISSSVQVIGATLDALCCDFKASLSANSDCLHISIPVRPHSARCGEFRSRYCFSSAQ